MLEEGKTPSTWGTQGKECCVEGVELYNIVLASAARILELYNMIVSSHVWLF